MTALAVLVVENPAVQGRGGGVARRQDRSAAGVDDGVGGHGSSLLGPLPRAPPKLAGSLGAARQDGARGRCGLLLIWPCRAWPQKKPTDFFPVAPRRVDRLRRHRSDRATIAASAARAPSPATAASRLGVVHRPAPAVALHRHDP